MASVDEIVRDYFAVWNETDSNRRAQVLERMGPISRSPMSLADCRLPSNCMIHSR